MRDDLLIRNLNVISKQSPTKRRYVAQVFDPDEPKRWGVWDRGEQKYLKDREIAALSVQEIQEPFAN